MKPKKYHIQAEIGSGICLPESKDYQICITVGEQEWSSGDPKQGKTQGFQNYCRWSRRISEEFESCHQHLATFPDVLIYLMDGKKPVCYWRGDITRFRDPDAPT